MSKNKTIARPNTATLNSEQYNTLLRLCHAADLTQIRAQQMLREAQEKRNAYYAEIAAQYHLPPSFRSMTWNDTALTIEVTA